MTSRIVVVTGAASGIGQSTATAFAAEGAQLVLLDRSEDVLGLAERMRSEGQRCVGITTDLGNMEQLLAATRRIHDVHGGCDVLVNNAGIHPKTAGRITPFESTTLDEWEKVLRVNLTAPFVLAQQFVPGMKERGWGRVINVSSRAGRTYSDRAGTHYVASKAGLIGLTRKIAGDFAAYGVTVNCVAPGQIATGMAAQSAPSVLQAASRDALIGRVGTPEEVAATIVFLASEAAGYITGAVVDVNGGAFIG